MAYRKRNTESVRSKKTDKMSLIDKLGYWIENQMAKGVGGMMLILFILTMIIVLLGTFIKQAMYPGHNPLVLLWNNATTAINAGMPEIEESEEIEWLNYLITAAVAIAGLFITSALIGIIAGAIEEKMEELRKGKRKLLLNDHIVILGSENLDQYLEVLTEYAEGETCNVLIADTLEVEQLDEILKYGDGLPENIHLHVRNVSIGDKEALQLCAIPDARSVIIQTGDDNKTLKSAMAVSALLKEYPGAGPRVVVGVSSGRRMLPNSALDPRVLMIQTGKNAGRIIAGCCVNPGLVTSLSELIGSAGCEFCVDAIPELTGHSFEDVIKRLEGAAPVGVLRDETQYLVPDSDFILQEGDRVIYCGQKQCSVRPEKEISKGTKAALKNQAKKVSVAVFGANYSLLTIMESLKNLADFVVLIPKTDEDEKLLTEISEQYSDITEIREMSLFEQDSLREIMRSVNQVIILNKELSDIEGYSEETARAEDADNVVLLHNIQDLVKSERLDLHITVELIEGSWYSLIEETDFTEIIVKKDMQALMVAQAALNPRAVQIIPKVARLSTRAVSDYINPGKYSAEELRNIMYDQKCALIGFLLNRDGKNMCILNPKIEEMFELRESDRLLVIAQQVED